MEGPANTDSNVAKMRELVGTPSRTDPITGHTYALDMPDVAQQWALAQYINEDPADTGEFAVAINLNFTNPAVNFAEYVANTVDHELGHTFGLNEGYFSQGSVADGVGVRAGGGTAQVRADGNAYPYDIMSNGQAGDGNFEFEHPIDDILRAAVGLAPNFTPGLSDAVTTWRNAFNLVNGRYADGGHDENGIRTESPNPLTTPEIKLTRGAISYFGAGQELISFDTTGADGAGGELADIPLELFNDGVDVLTLSNVGLGSGNSGFSIATAGLDGLMLDPQQSTTIDLFFDPTMIGYATDTLIIKSNAGTVPVFNLKLDGRAISATPSAVAYAIQNTIGGAVLGSEIDQAAADGIRNDGSTPLEITDIYLVDGSASFTLTGIPNDLTTTPIVLDTGEVILIRRAIPSGKAWPAGCKGQYRHERSQSPRPGNLPGRDRTGKYALPGLGKRFPRD